MNHRIKDTVCALNFRTSELRIKRMLTMMLLWQQHAIRQGRCSPRKLSAAAYRTFSSSPPGSSNNNNNSEKDLPDMASVVQGPSLVNAGVFRPSPSLMLLPGMRSLPFWTSLQNGTNRVAYQDPMVSHIVEYLESHASQIRNEYQSVVGKGGTNEQEEDATKVQSDYDVQNSAEHADDSLHQGSWDWYSFMQKGQIQPNFCQNFPETSKILEHVRRTHLLFEDIPFGFCFFSKLHPQSSIHSHSAPMNFRLRLHLPLIVPDSSAGTTTTTTTKETHGLSCGIRVGPTVQPWTTDRAIVLDDAYEHEVWNHTNEERVLLLVDIWHPDVQKQERERIVAMFQHAKEQGWIGSK